MGIPIWLGLLFCRRDLHDAASWTTYLNLIEHLIHDISDGAGTTTALSSATKTRIDSTRRAVRRRLRDSSHLIVAQHVAGADNHRKVAPIAGLQRNSHRSLWRPSSPKRTNAGSLRKRCSLAPAYRRSRATMGQRRAFIRSAGGSMSIDDELA